MSDIKLLPPPKWLLEGFTDQTIEMLCDYTRANVEHHTKALRAEVDRWKSNYNEAIELKGRAFAESDRLAEVLREAQPFIGWIGSYDELHAKIDAALAAKQGGA